MFSCHVLFTWVFLPGFSLHPDILCRSIFTPSSTLCETSVFPAVFSWGLGVLCLLCYHLDGGERGSSEGAMCSGACGIGFCSSSNFVSSPNTWFITPKWGLILFLYMGSSELWIISPIQGRIIETIYLDIYSPDVSQLFPTILSGKGRKRDKIQIPSSATVLFLRSGVCVGAVVGVQWESGRTASVRAFHVSHSIREACFLYFLFLFLSGKSLHIVLHNQLQ